MKTLSTHSPSLHWIRFLLLVCLCMPLLTSCESRKIIVNGLDEREANEILVYLSSKGVDAVKVQNTAATGGGGGPKVVLWDISVDSNQSLEAMSYLNQAGLPRRRSQSLLNIFTGTGLVPSETEQEIRYQAGLAEQIASTIRKIDGVLDAEVQLSFPKEDPLNPAASKQRITASVWVKHNGVLDDPNSHLVTKIKRLVAASVPNLGYDNVTVIGERAKFSELPIVGPVSGEEEKNFVTIWGLTLGKDSVVAFRILFFSFTLFSLILILMLVWLSWKIYPLIKEHGGVKEIFSIKPVNLEKKGEDRGHPAEEKEEATTEEKDKPEDETESTADKNVDQT